MRWDNLKVGSAGPAALPGFDRGTVTRTFDAPEAVGIRFHEIEARSAINDVGPMSYVDFRHTINPYRGCTHACAYCVWGGARVLRGDGRTTAIADLRVGDEIYGTRFEGRYRRYVKTRVLNHWETKKPAFAIRFENGTELIASGDHRFLSDRGWKYVTGTEQGRGRRPHLTTNKPVVQPRLSLRNDPRRRIDRDVLVSQKTTRRDGAPLPPGPCRSRRARSVEGIPSGVRR